MNSRQARKEMFAMKKKQKQKAVKSLRCPYCGSPMTLRPESAVYPIPRKETYLYVCNRYPSCDTYVGTHSGTQLPLGTPANGDLRNLRIRAHQKFDQIWKSGIMPRADAYRWFADSFGLRLRDAHIGHCSEYQCRELMRRCEEVLARNHKSA